MLQLNSAHCFGFYGGQLGSVLPVLVLFFPVTVFSERDLPTDLLSEPNGRQLAGEHTGVKCLVKYIEGKMERTLNLHTETSPAEC